MNLNPLKQKLKQEEFNRRSFMINPKLSINGQAIQGKSKLEIYKDLLINLRIRKSMIPQVPVPTVVTNFQNLKNNKKIQFQIIRVKKSIAAKKKQYQRFQKVLKKYKEQYDSKEQSIKQKVFLNKILSNKLQTEYQKIRDRFKEVEFNKVINNGIKKLWYYQLAEILFNNQAREIFSSQSVSKNDQQVGICLGYLGLLIQMIARISGTQMWIQFTFKGPKSTIKVLDLKKTQIINGKQVEGATFVLNSKQNRLNQALNLMYQQLYQIMKYSMSINIQVGKNPSQKNFYNLCQELSKYLLLI